MNNSNSFLKVVGLVTRAKQGDKASMDRLALAVQGRLFAYIYRLTLSKDMTRELLQETLLELVKSIGNLKRADRFWPWIFKVAHRKVLDYFRDNKKGKAIKMSAIDKENMLKRARDNCNEGLENLVKEELSEAICDAISKLRISQRDILALRCYEQLSYKEIAEIMDCSELRARVLLSRAKSNLKRNLINKGFNKTMLLTAICLFGIITAPAKASSAGTTITTVTAATAAYMQVGFAAALIGAMSTKLGIAITTVVAAITITMVVKAIVYITVGLCFTALLVLLLSLARR